jgi:L,D-peptidoglycan transpeptidase YkuD (ErfK/YbiS/YcfS/YnhG family)
MWETVARHIRSRIMKTSLCLLGALVICVSGTLIAQVEQQDPLAVATQIIVVTTSGWDSPEGTLRRYERQHLHGKWKSAGAPIAVTVGKNGLAWGYGVVETDTLLRDAGDPDKKEGDGKAPAGVFRLSKAFGYSAQPQPGWKMPYLTLTSSVECVDDTSSRFYNKVVDRGTVAPDWNSSEKMLRSDELYRWGILVDHNTDPAIAARGSCIFMHIWRGPGQPTVGCTAMPQAEIEFLLGWLDASRKPLLVQLPRQQYQRLRKSLRLPALEGASEEKKSGIQHGSESVGR